MKKMIKKEWMLILTGIFFSCSCSTDDNAEIDKPENGVGGRDETEEIANIYPAPPEEWFGSNNPYNATGWVGDIMPYFEDGKFQLFFLHDEETKPEGEGFHDIDKFTSSNLTQYNYEGRMINHGDVDEPDFALGTGSVVEADGTYYFYYTGHNGNSNYVQNNPRESVMVATSNDLEQWEKDETFILTAPTGYYDYEFRDPHVFYNNEEGEYWMLVSTQRDDRRAVILLFTSSDPASQNWEAQGPLYTTTEEEDYLMMECPDIFKMGNYWYLLFSENWKEKATHYRISTSSTGPWETPTNDMLDGEFFYAAKTASNQSERYLFGWTARRLPETNTRNKEWAGNLVTHQLVQNNNGSLGVKTPSSIDNLFNQKKSLEIIDSEGNTHKEGNSFELNASDDISYYIFSAPGPVAKISTEINIEEENGTAGFMFKADNSFENTYRIAFDPSNSRVVSYVNGNEVNSTPFNLETGQDYSIEMFTEGSICVVYINEEKAFTNRIYGMSQEGWGIFSEGIKAKFSEIEVTTP